MSSAFPNAGGAVEDTRGICMMERRLKSKFEWTELPEISAGELSRMHGAGAELAEAVFSSDDTGTFTPYKLRVVMHGGATRRPARFRILLDPPYVWISAARRWGDINSCALGSDLAICQPVFLETATFAPGRHQHPHCQGLRISLAAPPRQTSNSN